MSADAAGGVSGSGGVLSRTEMRGGSYKLHREMARTLTRESNAARRYSSCRVCLHCHVASRLEQMRTAIVLSMMLSRESVL